MGSRRQQGFVLQVLHRLNGIELYAKDGRPTVEGDTFVVPLKRGVASNKASRIEIIQERAGTARVSFLKGTSGDWIVISEHSGVFLDRLGKLLMDEAGLLTAERRKEDGAGQFRTTRW